MSETNFGDEYRSYESRVPLGQVQGLIVYSQRSKPCMVKSHLALREVAFFNELQTMTVCWIVWLLICWGYSADDYIRLSALLSGCGLFPQRFASLHIGLNYYALSGLLQRSVFSVRYDRAWRITNDKLRITNAAFVIPNIVRNPAPKKKRDSSLRSEWQINC